eukprot:9184746-Alexandrium_andersonii.AAC.1
MTRPRASWSTRWKSSSRRARRPRRPSRQRKSWLTTDCASFSRSWTSGGRRGRSGVRPLREWPRTWRRQVGAGLERPRRL